MPMMFLAKFPNSELKPRGYNLLGKQRNLELSLTKSAEAATGGREVAETTIGGGDDTEAATSGGDDAEAATSGGDDETSSVGGISI